MEYLNFAVSQGVSILICVGGTVFIVLPPAEIVRQLVWLLRLSPCRQVMEWVDGVGRG